MGILILAIIITAFVVYKIFIKKRDEERKALYNEILASLKLTDISSYIRYYDDHVTVKSKATLDKYDNIKYLKEFDKLDTVKRVVDKQIEIKKKLEAFIKQNDFMDRKEYGFCVSRLQVYLKLCNGYKVNIAYITSAGNNRGSRVLRMTSTDVKEYLNHPEYFMTKAEYNKLVKQQNKEKLENKKHALYDQVNEIINNANNCKDNLIIKSKLKELDELISNLFDRTVNSISKIKNLESDEWEMIENLISDTRAKVNEIISFDKKIHDYYESSDFKKIKETCSLITSSQKEFNDYIKEKAESISKLFGTRVVRNETENEDTYNFIRPYKKTITPFTCEVSAQVFSSAENSPIDYTIKYFYPNKSQYKTQIEKLRILIEELETLKEAKVIIETYIRDYDEYISNVPDFVLKNDEKGFYERLGLTIIDEEVLNIEYKFAYTSDGGKAGRSFTVPMTEETITELINRLTDKLSSEALRAEQRSLMTQKLRNHIKERDDFTCKLCGNSTHREPNLLLEIDHITPIAKGGLTVEENLQTLCWKCNRSKGSKLLDI